MLNKLDNAFLEFFEGQKEIKEKSVGDFYNSFDKETLKGIILRYYVLSDSDKDLIEFSKYNAKKSEMVDFICDNLEEILKSCIINLDMKTCENVLDITSKKGVRMYDDFRYRPLFSLIDLHIGYVKYDKKLKKFLIFIPEESRKLINKILKDDDILECIKDNENLGSILLGTMSTYGVMSVTDLSNLLGMDDKYLLDCIYKRKLTDGCFELVLTEDDVIVGVIGLDEKFMLNLNEEHKKYKIRKYSLDDYKKIDNGNYVEELKSYKKLKKYLIDYYSFDNSDLILFRDIIVLNFITNSEQREYDPVESLHNDLLDFIEKDEVEYKKIEKMIKDIYKEYPKWEKFGNV